jgi:hypothetical protein
LRAGLAGGGARNQDSIPRVAVSEPWYKWFLLEPLFTTTRSRMMLQPGTMSAVCITVLGRDCVDRIASVLNAGACSTEPAHDGYPPGNSAVVSNPQRDVACMGALDVVGRVANSAAATAPAAQVRAQQEAPPKISRVTGGSVLV